MTFAKTYSGLLALVILLMLPHTSVQAQSQGFSRTLDRLSAMNRINPLQNRDFERSDKVLNRDIQDRKNKIVGMVKDINVQRNGTIETINADFDRLRLSNEVPLNFSELNVRSREDSYVLNLDASDIEDFYPQLLANIDTASGDGVETISVKRIVGSELVAEDGRRIGRVDQVLFNSNGSRVDGLFVELSKGGKRGDTAAIPFRAARFDVKNGRLRTRISNRLTEALDKVAK